MSARPTIIFDLDGTLADTIRDLVPAMNRTTARFDINPVTASQVANLTGMGGMKAMISRAFQLSGEPLGKDLLEELFVASVEDYRQNIAVETVYYPHVRACLQQFTAEGWLLGVCTNKPVRLAEKLLRELGDDGLFASITGGNSFDFKKPDPQHLIQTIEMAGGSPTTAIMVGDTQNDILTAQNADIPVIAVDFGYSEHPVENYGPNRVISSFETLFEEAVKLIG
jgi:phosphoglycolate phosphatase